MENKTQITHTHEDSLMAILKTIRKDFLMLQDGSWDGSEGIQYSLRKLDEGIRIVNSMHGTKDSMHGTYNNGHDRKLIYQLNKVLEGVSDDTILEELFVNYFDDKDIDGIIEFFEDRFGYPCKREIQAIEEFMYTDGFEHPKLDGSLPFGDYRTSWGWLMPVVDKCFNEGGLDNPDREDIVQSLAGVVDRKATYKAVVKFIYNLKS